MRDFPDLKPINTAELDAAVQALSDRFNLGITGKERDVMLDRRDDWLAMAAKDYQRGWADSAITNQPVKQNDAYLAGFADGYQYIEMQSQRGEL